MSDVTFAITSCGRPELLEKTIESFLKLNSYPIDRYLIIEDKNENSVFVKTLITSRFPQFELEITEKRIGQIKAIEKIYKKIDTKYVFHCEDDWLFTKSGFIEKSIPILEKNKDVLQVHIRKYNKINGHPVSNGYLLEDIPVRKLNFNYLKVWHGFSWNPGLRRTEDILINGKLLEYKYEHEFSIHYKNLGFYVVVLDDEEGYVEHIGWGQHVKDPFGV